MFDQLMRARRCQQVIAGLGCFTALCATGLASPAFAAPGDRDPSFSGDGVATVPAITHPSAMAVEPGGSVLVVGSVGEGGRAAVLVARYREDGRPDRAFGDGGLVRLKLGRGVSASDMALQPDGRIVICGRARGNRQLILLRLLPDGELDTSFGSGGAADPTDSVGAGYATAITDDGKIVVAALSRADVRELAVLRLLPDGSLDTSFGSAGVASSPVGSVRFRGSIALGTEGSVFAGGSGLALFDERGTLDSTFGTDGAVPFSSASTYEMRTIVTQSSGRLVVGYRACETIGPLAGCRDALARLATDGRILGARAEDAGSRLVAIESGGLFALGSRSFRGLTATATVSALTAGTRPVRTFGQHGQAPVYVGLKASRPVDIGVASDGKIVELAQVLGDGPTLIVRLEVDSGPADADADGVPDSADLCRFGHAETASGCRVAKRELQIERPEDGFLEVTIHADTGACVYGSRIGLFRSAAGRDPRVQSKTVFTRRRESVTFAVNDPGRFYASVRPDISALARCAGARSAVLRG